MTGGVYVGGVARDQLATADAELYCHLPVTPGGQCVTCGEPEPCRARYAALGVFLRYGVLPKRRPGAAGVRVTDQPWRAFAVDHTRSKEAR
jgi:hypothetical protein